MIFWSWGKKVREISRQVGIGECGACHTDEWLLMLTYKYFALFVVAGIAWDRQYFIQCATCGSSAKQDTSVIEKHMGGNKIPLHLRYGLYFVLGSVAFTVIVNLVAAAL